MVDTRLRPSLPSSPSSLFFSMARSIVRRTFPQLEGFSMMATPNCECANPSGPSTYTQVEIFLVFRLGAGEPPPGQSHSQAHNSGGARQLAGSSQNLTV